MQISIDPIFTDTKDSMYVCKLLKSQQKTRVFTVTKSFAFTSLKEKVKLVSIHTYYMDTESLMHTETREKFINLVETMIGFIPNQRIILLHAISTCCLLVPFTCRTPQVGWTLIEEPLKVEKERHLPFFSVS